MEILAVFLILKGNIMVDKQVNAKMVVLMHQQYGYGLKCSMLEHPRASSSGTSRTQ